MGFSVPMMFPVGLLEDTLDVIDIVFLLSYYVKSGKQGKGSDGICQ